MTDSGALTLREEELIRPDYNNGKIILSFHRAAKTAGLIEAESLRFNPTHVDGDPVLVACGMDRRVDGRSHVHSRPLIAVGGEPRRGTRVNVPQADFQTVFGLSISEVQELENAGELPAIQVFAAPGAEVVAFRQAGDLTVPKEVIPDVVE